MKDIGKKLRQLREEKGMTQEELAHKVGYKSRVSINKIELQRDVPLKKLSLIAKALDVSPSELAGWEEYDTDKKQDHSITKTDEKCYYLSDAARDMAEFLHKNPEYKVLFDASRKVKPEDLEKAIKAVGLFIEEE